MGVSIRETAASFIISTIIKSDNLTDQKSSGRQNCSSIHKLHSSLRMQMMASHVNVQQQELCSWTDEASEEDEAFIELLSRGKELFQRTLMLKGRQRQIVTAVTLLI